MNGLQPNESVVFADVVHPVLPEPCSARRLVPERLKAGRQGDERAQAAEPCKALNLEEMHLYNIEGEKFKVESTRGCSEKEKLTARIPRFAPTINNNNARL